MSTIGGHREHTGGCSVYHEYTGEILQLMWGESLIKPLDLYGNPCVLYIPVY